MVVLIDLFLHFDKHLAEFVQTYAVWVCGLLVLVVFAESGLAGAPFLPGDSVPFAAGELAAPGSFGIWVLLRLQTVAAILGGAANSAVAGALGERVFTSVARTSFWHRVLNRDLLTKAHAFF